ncbi:7-carboxy-7-deazaguanine synthase [Abditibacteriota bacterium]|nr:7-carboxy-7-deazaguanine synthase [Abditibacteriota bacterium]
MPDILISEIFGPTIQGEGALAGRLTVFVRTGGCDSLCQWCDTLYAVLPKFKSEWTKMSAAQIIEKIEEYSQGKPILVTVSGGNPALQPLEELLELGHARGHRFALETQGTKAPQWLSQLDFLTISPKPPSSGMKFDVEALRRCVEAGERGGHPQISLKVVVFDEADYEFARAVWREFPGIPFYLSVGTQPSARAEGDGAQIMRGIEWLIEKAARDGWNEAVILPQIHVLLWGQKRGV